PIAHFADKIARALPLSWHRCREFAEASQIYALTRRIHRREFSHRLAAPSDTHLIARCRPLDEPAELGFRIGQLDPCHNTPDHLCGHLCHSGCAQRIERYRESRPVSRVLSRAVIPLGSPSPWTSSGLPGSARGSALRRPLLEDRRGFPIWPCSRWGLPCRRVLPPTRCALTAPFHPCRSREGLGR